MPGALPKLTACAYTTCRCLQVQALLGLLDKGNIGMYEPDVARDVLTLVRACMQVFDSACLFICLCVCVCADKQSHSP